MTFRENNDTTQSCPESNIGGRATNIAARANDSNPNDQKARLKVAQNAILDAGQLISLLWLTTQYHDSKLPRMQHWMPGN